MQVESVLTQRHNEVVCLFLGMESIPILEMKWIVEFSWKKVGIIFFSNNTHKPMNSTYLNDEFVYYICLDDGGYSRYTIKINILI